MILPNPIMFIHLLFPAGLEPNIYPAYFLPKEEGAPVFRDYCFLNITNPKTKKNPMIAL
jgi:hypothetical protein